MVKHLSFRFNLLVGVFSGVFLSAFFIPISGAADFKQISMPPLPLSVNISDEILNDLDVPFYSQFADIKSLGWQKKGCGIASLAMIIEFYKPKTVLVEKLLKEGIAAGAYIKNAGWSHQGIALLAESYGLNGKAYDLAQLKKEAAFAELKKILKEGPVIASVHYKLDPKNPIPHLIVVNYIEGDAVYYNDPAEKSGGNKISINYFIKAWKKRFIVMRLKG